MKFLNTFLLICSFFILICSTYAADKYITVKCKNGDGIHSLLLKYSLPVNDFYINHFKKLNSKKFDKKEGLFIGYNYKLPIKSFIYDGKSIKKSLNLASNKISTAIQDFNNELFKKRLIKASYKRSKTIWVPAEYFDDIDSQDKISEDNNKSEQDYKKKSAKSRKSRSKKGSESHLLIPYFGPNHIVKKTDNSLEGCFYYLSSGHGGPDPGARGTKDGHTLCEDEYAYDIMLRLAKSLIEHGAKVYMIVHDPNDGIRDEVYLNCDSDEIYVTRDTLSVNQTIRLAKRASIINHLYRQNKRSARLQQSIFIHVDSRVKDQRIDIFFYYQKDNPQGQELAKTIQQTIKEKYDAKQPGRGYQGTISTRSLYMLRETEPVGVYMELGNIQNKNDQVRLTDPNNRQAIANWICLGITKYAKKVLK